MNNLPNILYVDDEFFNLRLFEINLSKKYNVFKASNGLEALDMLKNNNDIKYIISDLRMPNMDGIEFIERAKKEFPDKLYFLLTGFDMTPEIKKALDSKLIVTYFKKPINLNIVDNTLSSIKM